MQYLLSLPANSAGCFNDDRRCDSQQWFATSDPSGKRIGSGGGTVWLLEDCYRNNAPDKTFEEWLKGDKRILIHAGGQSRRLPAYAPSGKLFTPIPIFRWARGQRLSQDLLSLQLPLYEKILQQSPQSLRTLIASGDVYIHTDEPVRPVPEADVVCYGLWEDISLASRHGVFALDRKSPDKLDFMMQKPSLSLLEKYGQSHYVLMDIGVWLLSDRAVEILRKRSRDKESGDLQFYDLYSDFGLALGKNPQTKDEEINALSVKIVPLQGGEFYHYGTSRELITSTLAIQNRTNDQRLIMHNRVKPHPAIFTQNAEVEIPFTNKNENVWIENSHISAEWSISSNHLITGVPKNAWSLALPSGVCIDAVPLGDTEWVARPYGINDAFKGSMNDDSTLWMGIPLKEWLSQHRISPDELTGNPNDIQELRLFPKVASVQDLGVVFQWMISDPQSQEGRDIWRNAERYSADELLDKANLSRLWEQRKKLRLKNRKMLEKNFDKSVFYQSDLLDGAREYAENKLPIPLAIDEKASVLQRIHNRMLRSKIEALTGDNEASKKNEDEAFSLMRNELTASLRTDVKARKSDVQADQIVWARTPVRIDLAGGWTDTPPYSLYCGGNVVNIAIELNGQPPLQVYVKPCEKFHIVLRSIDMGAVEIVQTFDELGDFSKIGSPFSIPKCAIALIGFLPQFSDATFASLEEQLMSFGCGMEVTLLSAIPAGSGLGTSSILAATVLGALFDFCKLPNDKHLICNYTLALEQLLTTGGGWQDQYGGVFHGVKLLQSESGFVQYPRVNWLPGHLFTDADYRSCHLLYYTGITRVAKNILAEIVSSMFLNSSKHLRLLDDMKWHALDMAHCIQRGDFEAYGKLLRLTWEQNKRLDSGTNPPQVERIIALIDDYAAGYKLPGAGGGGFLYMAAKDVGAAAHIRKILNENKPNNRARFVEMSLSDTGLQVSRS
ncbi:MAG: bifunctional fucokinase/L-fucose-1-P-guanylyltransferase [Dysgonamonadaceae bacterium]|jgi:galactokinase/mevalonate kinase-like predicted kinase|nr:bifunctional fucokinase/L-fucose-1-P-guanylyltransferase [Dysgonamonadaceae bacterium]